MDTSRSKQEPLLVFNLLMQASDLQPLLPISMGLSQKHFGEIILIENFFKITFNTLQLFGADQTE
jgi:hypothetical protein